MGIQITRTDFVKAHGVVVPDDFDRDDYDADVNLKAATTHAVYLKLSFFTISFEAGVPMYREAKDEINANNFLSNVDEQYLVRVNQL
jgi:hypothetical protein